MGCDTPTEDDARHMARLCRDRVRAHFSGVPFDYPLRLYTSQLANYFIRELEQAPRTRGTDYALETDGIQGIQQALGHMCLSSETTKAPGAMILAPHHRAELMCSLCVCSRRSLTMTYLWIWEMILME